jgi:hypothetical protein
VAERGLRLPPYESELADKLSIDGDGLQGEIAEYNRCCDGGVAPLPPRPIQSLTPIRRAPSYGYRWGQVLITTLGGLRKDECARVLDPDGAPIAVRYAARDVASTYTWCLSGARASATGSRSRASRYVTRFSRASEVASGHAQRT